MWVQKVLLLSGPEKGYDSQERLAVSTRELTRFGIPYEIIQGDFTEPSGYAAAKNFESTTDRTSRCFCF